MLKQETIEKIKRVETRLAHGERVKPALKAEHIAQATWYSPRVRKLRAARDMVVDKPVGEGPEAAHKNLPRMYEELPLTLRREIERLRRESEKLGVELVKEMLGDE